MRCTYRGCMVPPTASIAGEYDKKPWLGCPAHTPAMAYALGIGQRIDYTVTTTPLRRAA